MASPLSRPVKALGAALACALIILCAALLSGAMTADAQDATGFVADQAITVNTDALNLRDDASSSAGVIAVLPEGAYGVVLSGPTTDAEHSWYLIEVDGVSGYVAGEFLADAASTGAFAVGATVFVSTDLLNLRADATTSGAIVAELATGAAATVLSGPIEADGYAWYQIEADGVTGWSVRDYLALASTADSAAGDELSVGDGSAFLVNTDVLNVRDVAGLSGAVLETLATGDSISVTGANQSADGLEWAPVQTASGATGWVVASYLTADSADLLLTVGTLALVDTDGLNLRDAAATSGAILAELVTGEEVTILSASEAADGYLWYQVETTYGTGWVVGAYLSV